MPILNLLIGYFKFSLRYFQNFSMKFIQKQEYQGDTINRAARFIHVQSDITLRTQQGATVERILSTRFGYIFYKNWRHGWFLRPFHWLFKEGRAWGGVVTYSHVIIFMKGEDVSLEILLWFFLMRSRSLQRNSWLLVLYYMEEVAGERGAYDTQEASWKSRWPQFPLAIHLPA